MASPQTENGFIRIANELFSQILMRDFSKRQRSILDLVIRLSYGINKKTAYIPKLQYFEICGVHQKVVASELNALRDLNVIQMDAKTKTYWLNKDYDMWLTEPPKEKQEVSLTQLLAINIRSNSDQQNDGEHQQNIGKDQQNVGVGDGTHQQNIGEDTNKTLVNAPTKHWCFEPEIPRGSKADGMSKDIFKDSIKNIVVVVAEEATVEEFERQVEDAMKIRMENHHYRLANSDYQAFKQLMSENVPRAFILQGIDEAFNSYSPKHSRDRIRSFGYCATKILDRWKDEQSKRNGGAERATHRGTNQEPHVSDDKSVESYLRRKLQGQPQDDELLRLS